MHFKLFTNSRSYNIQKWKKSYTRRKWVSIKIERGYIFHGSLSTVTVVSRSGRFNSSKVSVTVHCRGFSNKWDETRQYEMCVIHTRATRAGGDLLVSLSGDAATHRALLSPWVSACVTSAPWANSSSTTCQHIAMPSVTQSSQLLSLHNSYWFSVQSRFVEQ